MVLFLDVLDFAEGYIPSPNRKSSITLTDNKVELGEVPVITGRVVVE